MPQQKEYTMADAPKPSRKNMQVRANKARTATASPKGSRKLSASEAKAQNKWMRQEMKEQKFGRSTGKDFETRSGREINKPKISASDARGGRPEPKGYPTVKGGSSSVSPRKASVKAAAVKGAKNKMKAQGRAINMTPSTTAYDRRSSRSK